ncbi:MAG: putative dehydrogenase/threonine dehydrogenase-like Zn-dependent dehydrogenase [Alphaproteobacteria bacterium]|jgi:predicted dehydrogenase/threonine dehydrogenase-like Zn-dependent dehydrogenase
MKQVLQNMKTGQMSLTEVPSPQVGAGEVLVATKASLISAGTEKMLIDFAKKSLLSKAQERPDLVQKVVSKMQRDGLASTLSSVFSKLEEPLPLGYSASGEVIAVGSSMKGLYQVGDRVSMAGAGFANHAEVNSVPKNLIAKIPENVPYSHASFATLVAIAMQGVRNSKTTLGDKVMVMGLGLVGQLTMQLLKAAGAQVFAVDFDAERLKTAEETGCDLVHALSAGNTESLVKDFTEGNGFDAIIICAATDSNDPLEQAIAYARDKATIVMTGKTGTTIPYADFMKKELNFVISRSYGPGRYDSTYEQGGKNYPIGFVRWCERSNLEEALHLMSTGALKIEPLISHNFPIEDAKDAYAMVLGKDISNMGVVLEYNSDFEQRLKPRMNLRPTELVTGKVGLSFIGAGSFARGVLLPTLKGSEEVDFTGIISKGGVTARLAGDKFGFNYVANNENEIINDAATQAVVIATRHNTHASLVCQALHCGKHVFVEKPLGMTYEELEQVEQEYRGSNKVLMVGFNRRYSPYVQALYDHFKQTAGARQVMIRVNAGKLEGDNWQHDPKTGGGRLIGEVCHFIDLALYLAGSPAVEVYAVAGQGQDVYNITIRHENGGTSTIIYTSEGDSSFSKELVEVYAGGTVGIIDNFRKAMIVSGGKKRKIKIKNGFFGGSQDKGHTNELVQFIQAVQGNSMPDVDAMFEASRLTLLIARSMEENKPLKVSV